MNFLLIGKSNVGKSSIFNILTTGKKNIIHKTEGTTRDWHKNNIRGLNNLYLYDSPGVIINHNKIDNLKFNKLLNEIDIFLYVLDNKISLSNIELESINELRKLNKKIILLINKDDNHEKNNSFNNLGVKDIYYLSCSHNYGFGELYSFFENFDSDSNYDFDIDYSIAIFGKPNAGKSTLVNNILGFDRSITSHIAGTTSDVVEDFYNYKNYNFKILDTAGINKKNTIFKDSVNSQSIKMTFNIIKKIDLSLLLIDSTEGFDNQVKKILNILLNKSNNIIILFNKIDLIKNKSNFINSSKNQVKFTFSKSKNISFIFLSAKKKSDIIKLKDFIFLKAKHNSLILKTSKINQWLKKATNETAHPLIKGTTVKFKYAVQVSSKPIIIKLFCNFSRLIKKNYKTYLENNFCKTFKIRDNNIKFIIVSSKNPFD